MINEKEAEIYRQIHGGAPGYFEDARSLIEVSGREAVQFLNGMITSDVAKLEDGEQMLAAFPNAQGRLLALVRVRKSGARFLFETERATGEKVYQNLFRFTFAGDFFVENLTENYRCWRLTENAPEIGGTDHIAYRNRFGTDVFVPAGAAADDFLAALKTQNAAEIPTAVYEVLRVEKGVPRYGVDMDETTIVPELGLENLISYNKGCYIGQEIIARIHFRGHIAKQLSGLIFEGENAAVKAGDEIKSLDGKNAGRVTSVCFSPRFERTIALAYVRYDYLTEGTELRGGDCSAAVKSLPFV